MSIKMVVEPEGGLKHDLNFLLVKHLMYESKFALFTFLRKSQCYGAQFISAFYTKDNHFVFIIFNQNLI